MRTMILKRAALAAVLGGMIESATADYSKSYAVVVSQETYADAEWQAVADALVKKHGATLVQYEGKVTAALPELKRVFPKYTCFVARPAETGFNHIVDIHRMTRKLDDDPYGDTIWGVVTGFTPADALRMAQATEPSVVSSALLTAGMGPERWKEAHFLSTHTRSEVGHKTVDGEIVRELLEVDMTHYWVDAWNTLDPDAIVSSAHASQRNLEMPFSRGNIICRDGKLYGYVTRERMIDASGQAIDREIEGKLVPLNAPKKPKLHFAVGNCLIGDIPDRNCMALAMMGFGKANQMIGYTVTTWYGKAGWGTLKYWEQMGGVAPLNEAFYFNHAWIQHRLALIDPALPTTDWAVGDRDLQQKNFGPALREVLDGKRPSRDAVGLCHDRDVVAFYGDPALEIRLDPEYTTAARRTIDLAEKDGVWTATIHAHADHETPTIDSTPIGIFFPQRLKNLKLISGKEFAPLLSDNHLLVTAPGPFKAGEKYRIVFSGCASDQHAATPEAFAKQYIAAVNTGDKEELRKLVHPECYATLTEAQSRFFEDALEMLVDEPFPEKRTIKIAEGEFIFDLEDPILNVTPTHEMSITSEQHICIQHIIQGKDQWFFVLPTFDSHEIEEHLENHDTFY